jgi:hypothetical protein
MRLIFKSASIANDTQAPKVKRCPSTTKRSRRQLAAVVLGIWLASLASAGGVSAKEQASSKVVASGDHWKITEGELDDQARPQLQLLQRMMDQTRGRVLNAMVDRRVLEAAAQKAKLSPDDYMKKEVDNKISPPSDADAKKFYDSHKNLFSAPYEKVRDELKRMLRAREITKQRAVFLQELRKKSNVKVDIPMPPSEGLAARRPGGNAMGLQELLKLRGAAAKH